ncbi:MAG: amidohydrolase family protein [Candidatus Helarchaeota archaeon]
MRIDFHCHLFYRRNINSIGLLKTQFKDFEKYGFYNRILNYVQKTETIKTNDIIEKTIFHIKKAKLDKVVLLPLSDKENQIVKQWWRMYPDIFIPFYNPPEKGTLEFISNNINENFKDTEFKGLKIMLPFRRKQLNDKILFPILEIAENYQVPVLFHTGYPPPGTRKQVLIYANPIYLDEIINSFINLKIIIAHVGYPFVDIAIALAVQYPNVYLDISNLTYMQPKYLREMIIRAKEIIGVNKILFGSDAFVPEMLEMTIEYFKSPDFLTEEEIKKIIGLNAKNLLGI